MTAYWLQNETGLRIPLLHFFFSKDFLRFVGVRSSWVAPATNEARQLSKLTIKTTWEQGFYYLVIKAFPKILIDWDSLSRKGLEKRVN